MLGMSAYSDWFGLLVDCGLMCCCYALFVLLVLYCVVLLLGFGFRLDFDFFDVKFVDLLWRFCGVCLVLWFRAFVVVFEVCLVVVCVVDGFGWLLFDLVFLVFAAVVGWV